MSLVLNRDLEDLIFFYLFLDCFPSTSEHHWTPPSTPNWGSLEASPQSRDHQLWAALEAGFIVFMGIELCRWWGVDPSPYAVEKYFFPKQLRTILKSQLMIYCLTPWGSPESKNSCPSPPLLGPGEWLRTVRSKTWTPRKHTTKSHPAPEIWLSKRGCDSWFPISYICKGVLRMEIKWEPTGHILWA